jgi:hypothetical protein
MIPSCRAVGILIVTRPCDPPHGIYANICVGMGTEIIITVMIYLVISLYYLIAVGFDTRIYGAFK